MTQGLHLIRLAESARGRWVPLPAGVLSVINLTQSGQTTGRGWLVCLRGGVVIDLAEGGYVHLGEGEAYELRTEGILTPLTLKETVLLHFG